MPQLEQLQYLLSEAFWLILVFVSIYVFIGRFFIPRIGSIVEVRKEQIKSDLSLAEKLAHEYKEIAGRIEEILEQARQRGHEIKAQASKKAENQVHQSIYEFEKDLSRKAALDEAKLSRLESQLAGEVDKIAHGLSREVLEVILKSYASNSNNIGRKHV